LSSVFPDVEKRKGGSHGGFYWKRLGSPNFSSRCFWERLFLIGKVAGNANF